MYGPMPFLSPTNPCMFPSNVIFSHNQRCLHVRLIMHTACMKVTHHYMMSWRWIQAFHIHIHEDLWNNFLILTSYNNHNICILDTICFDVLFLQKILILSGVVRYTESNGGVLFAFCENNVGCSSIVSNITF